MERMVSMFCDMWKWDKNNKEIEIYTRDCAGASIYSSRCTTGYYQSCDYEYIYHEGNYEDYQYHHDEDYNFDGSALITGFAVGGAIGLLGR